MKNKKKYYLCYHEDYEGRKDCASYGPDPVFEKYMNCRWVYIMEIDDEQE